MRTAALLFVTACSCLATTVQAFVVLPFPAQPTTSSASTITAITAASNQRHQLTSLQATNGPNHHNKHHPLVLNVQRAVQSAAVCLALAIAPMAISVGSPTAAFAADADTAILSCLLQKCKLPLAKCIANPKCLANVVCINTCTGRPDEIDCQIKCGDIFDNPVIGDFNKCAVSDMDCVKQKPDDGSYPVPAPSAFVKKFDTSLFEGRWYITAGQNELFDIFPCQVHFFSKTGVGSFVGKLNWRIQEPDGEYFTRDALQAFKQDKNQPGHLLNHDNEYLHYQDDWWIIDYENDNNDAGVPPFAFVYYRGSNDAWDGYGGVFVYTREAKLPDSLLPRMREAAKKVNFDFDKDFVVTDNSCPTQSTGDRTMLREQFAGKVALQTEQQLQAQATRLRGNAVNSVKAQKLFFDQEGTVIEKAFKVLDEKTREFEDEVVKDAIRLEEEVARDGDKLLNRNK